MSNLTFLVTYTAKPGMRQAYVQALRDHGYLETIRKENGCLCYDFYYSEENENVLLLVEKWIDENSQKIHMEQPHMKKVQELKSEYIDQTELVKTAPL